jgi:CRP/FNR family transcriptional regulator, cyclic AMP receptor protein
MNTQDYLTKIPIFHGLFSADFGTLTKLLHERTMHKSDILFRKGDTGSSMFIIEEGTVEITVPGGNKQKEVCVAVLKEGDFFGELSLIDGLPRTATATATHDCTLLEMNRADFIQFLLDRPRVAISMLSEMGKRLQTTNDLVTSLASKNVNVEMDEQMSFSDKLADRVADFVGSWKFLIIFLICIVIWCVFNIIELIFLPFDPYPFVFLNLVLAVVASFQAPLIMMSQNRAQIKDRLRADLDYQVNLKSELLLQQLHAKIDEIRSVGDSMQ